MSEIKNGQELAEALGTAAKSLDPVAELKARGFQFTGELASLLAENASRPKPPAAVWQKLAPFAAAAGPVKVRAGAASAAVLLLAPGDYDVVASLRFNAVNLTLAGLYASFRIPHTIPLQSLVDSSIVSSILAILRGSFTGVPPDATLGDLHLDGPPEASEIAETSMAAVSVPFSIDVHKDAQTISARGRVTLVAQLSAEVKIALSLATFKLSFPPFPEPFHPGLAIDGSSALQPNSAQSAARLAALIQLVMARVLQESLSISPILHLPIPSFGTLNLIIEHVDLITNSAPQSGVMIVGIRFAGAGPTPPNPHLLLNQIPEANHNMLARVDQRYFQRVLDLARQNGQLAQELSTAQQANIKVRGIRLEFAPGEIRVMVDGTKVDACLFVDVDFTATLSIKIELLGNQIKITPSTDLSVSTWDQVKCAIVGAGVGVLVALPAFFVNPVLGGFLAALVSGLIIAGFSSGGSGGGSGDGKLIDLDTPIPGTELLPTLSNLLSSATPGVLTAHAVVGTRPDDVNTYVYARFLGTLFGGPLGASGATPLRSATIRLIDQDVPPPAGDDAPIPASTETEKITPKFITTTTVTYQPPSSDEVLGSATTDLDGRVMFMLRPGTGRSAGTVITTTTKEPVTPPSHHPPHGGDPGGDVSEGDGVETHSETVKVTEKAPDLYFRILAVDVDTDSRKLANGIFVNFQQKHLGSAAQPVSYTVRRHLLIATQ
jgi:hypothetical protein